MIATERFELVEVDGLPAVRAWLTPHHGQADSVWLVRFKKGDAWHVDRLDLLDDCSASGGWTGSPASSTLCARCS